MNRYLQISAVGFGSGGSDLFGLRSNLGHRIRIGRLQAKGSAGRRRDVAGAELRGGARPELAERVLQSTNRAGAWPWGIAMACVVHLATQSSGLGFGTAGAAAVAGVCGGASTACGARRVRVAYGLIGVAQTEAWGSGVLTEGL